MSIQQTRSSLNRIDKKIADLNKKLAAEFKKEANVNNRINYIQKSITKSTSVSSLKSKNNQIQINKSALERIYSKKSDMNKKIADKQGKRVDLQKKLQKEESEEFKKAEKVQKSIKADYEKSIASLTSQIKLNATQNINPLIIYDEDTTKYDVFLSHASEDKESLVDDLCKELTRLDINVWYDVLNIQWGDSLRTSIDKGVSKSRFGIVIISNDYIKKGWTRYELDGLFQIEMSNGKTILPIWHNITKKEVQVFSPTLAGRLALNTSIMTPEEIARELEKILEANNNPEEKTNEQT